MNTRLSGLGENWVQEEFAHIHFGDKRLNKRFLETVESLSHKASSSINGSCHGVWSKAKGAYRLFGNERVNCQEMFYSHRIETSKRLPGHSQIFCLQDTTHLDFDSHNKTQGLGSISKAYRKHKMGLMLHAALMVTEAGLPLGISSLQCWSRVPQEETQQEKQIRAYTCAIEEKESFKWLEALQESNVVLPQDSHLITIGDREADIFELLQTAQELNTSFIIRNRQDRTWFTAQGTRTQLRTALSLAPLLDTMTIFIPKNHQRTQRTARVEIRTSFGLIPIRNNIVYGPKANTHEHSRREKLPVYIIGIQEPNPPQGVEAVDWVLLTNLPVMDAESAKEKIRWYQLRWKIEEFFRTLKSGCLIEQCRLNTADKLKKITILKSIIAFKLMYLTKAAASHPDEDCTQVLSKEEWQTLYRRIHQTATLPAKPPTILQAVTWIAKLGGFLHRKSDKLPGLMSLWRGYDILQESIQMARILQDHSYG
jgi:hypothetical protein